MGTLDNFLPHESFLSLFDCCLQKCYVNLLCSEKVGHSFLLLQPVGNHLTVVVSLLHAFTKLALVLLTTLGDPLEDNCTELVALLDHVSRLLHLLLVGSTLFLPLGLILAQHLLLLFIGALATIDVRVETLDHDETIALEVVKEGHDVLIDVIGRLR